MPRNDQLAIEAREAAFDYILCMNDHPMKKALKDRCVELYCELYLECAVEDEKIDRMMAL